MRATKIVEWTRNGKKVKVEIERVRGVEDKIIDLDGDRWTRKEAVDHLFMTVRMECKCKNKKSTTCSADLINQ